MKYAKKDSKNDLSMLPVAPIIINTPTITSKLDLLIIMPPNLFSIAFTIKYRVGVAEIPSMDKP